MVEIANNVTHSLLDIPHNVLLEGFRERISTLVQQLFEVISQVLSAKVDSLDSVRHRETLVDGHSVGDTIAGVEDDTSGAA